MRSPAEGGKDAGGGEENGDYGFFGNDVPAREWEEPARDVDAGEVGEGGYSEDCVALERADGHEGEDEDGGCAGGDDGERKEDLAMTPVEVMSQAEAM